MKNRTSPTASWALRPSRNPYEVGQVVASDPLATQEVPAADLETAQTTMLGAPLDQPRRHEARVARRGPGDPIPLSRPPDPLALGGDHRNRTGHHPAGHRQCITQRHDRPPHVLWRARCVGIRTPGSEGGSGKRTGGNAGTAPRPDPAPCGTPSSYAVHVPFSMTPAASHF